jgi:hypothetical protein
MYRIFYKQAGSGIESGSEIKVKVASGSEKIISGPQHCPSLSDFSGKEEIGKAGWEVGGTSRREEELGGNRKVTGMAGEGKQDVHLRIHFGGEEEEVTEEGGRPL